MTALFHSLSVFYSTSLFFFTLLLLSCFNLCVVAQKVCIVTGVGVSKRMTDAGVGQEISLCVLGVEEGWCRGCQGDTKPPRVRQPCWVSLHRSAGTPCGSNDKLCLTAV